MGNIYLPKALPLTELPDERMQFTLGFYGEGDFFTMKGVIEEFLEHIGMKKKAEYDPNAQKPWLHPGRQANVVYDGTVIGYLGEVHPKVMANYGIGQRTYVAVLDMPAVDGFASFDRKYEGIAKYPAVTRDISMVVPRTVLVGQIEKILAQRGGKILESYSLFDIYEGTQDGVPVPDVLGALEADATATLTRSGFTVTKADGYSDTIEKGKVISQNPVCLLYTSPSPRDGLLSRMPSSA